RIDFAVEQCVNGTLLQIRRRFYRRRTRRSGRKSIIAPYEPVQLGVVYTVMVVQQTPQPDADDRGVAAASADPLSFEIFRGGDSVIRSAAGIGVDVFRFGENRA